MSEDSYRRFNLSEHMNLLWSLRPHSGGVGELQADSILKDPQAHVDALVGAGVLHAFGTSYLVVQPDGPPVNPKWQEWSFEELATALEKRLLKKKRRATSLGPTQ